MNISLLILLLFAVATPLLLKKLRPNIEWQVIGFTLAGFLILACFAFYMGKAGQTMDVEVLNGEVTGKHNERVSCEHSYQCNCRQVQSCSTDSRGQRSCTSTTVCDTCYEHSYDVDWIVDSNIGHSRISRVDRQGLSTPGRWAATQVGEPYADTHIHTNYVKAVPESVFHLSDKLIAEKFKTMIPAYPKEIYDYYRINRALTVGVNVPDLQLWSNDISTILKQLGPQKQANIITLFVNTDDPAYEYALRQAWLGAKKNDIVVLFGTTQYPKIDWVRVMSWTDKEIFKVQLRDALQDMGTIDRMTMIPVIKDLTLKEFKRKSMKDFAYLENEIDPPTWVIILAIVLMIGVAGFIYKQSAPFTGRRMYGRRSF